MYTLKGHSGPVSACAFSADGTRFASGGEDGLVMSWRSHLDNRLGGGGSGGVSGRSMTLGAASFDDRMMSMNDGAAAVDAAAVLRGRPGGGMVTAPGRQQEPQPQPMPLPHRTALGVRTTNAR